MLLNLREIIEIPGASVDFETELETDRLDFPAIKEYKAKPKAVGRVYNETTSFLKDPAKKILI